MLTNLKAEIVRKGLEPTKTIARTLGCTEKTARNKLDGKSAVTVPEANSIISKLFTDDGFTIEYLFVAQSTAV